MSRFIKFTAMTTLTRVLIMLLVLPLSIIIARFLGPAGKGTFALSLLLPSLILTLLNVGIVPATVYHVSKKTVSLRETFNTNVVLGLAIAGAGISVGVLVVCFLRDVVVPGVPLIFLLLGLLILPSNLIYRFVSAIFWGRQKLTQYNILQIVKNILPILTILVSFALLGISVFSVMISTVLASLLVAVITFLWVKKYVGGFSLAVSRSLVKKSLTYGLQAHLGNILGFLNYRLDMFLVNIFLNPAALGFYSISVHFAESLWLVSQSAGMVLLPRIAAETEEEKRRKMTPLVARTVLWLTAAGGIVAYFLSSFVIRVLYTDKFLPCVAPFRILLIGITIGSASRVMANDIAARGKPIWNSSISFVALVLNIILNVIWIPRYGISGAAWATSVSYSTTLFLRMLLYAHLSKNSWFTILLPRLEDWKLYWSIVNSCRDQIWRKSYVVRES